MEMKVEMRNLLWFLSGAILGYTIRMLLSCLTLRTDTKKPATNMPYVDEYLEKLNWIFPNKNLKVSEFKEKLSINLHKKIRYVFISLDDLKYCPLEVIIRVMIIFPNDGIYLTVLEEGYYRIGYRLYIASVEFKDSDEITEI